MKTITNITHPAFALFAFACFALSPMARAVDPPPDGGYPGANTAEGEDALLSLTTGVLNTAIGFNALLSNTEGDSNTAIGGLALQNNATGSANTAIGVLPLASNTTGSSNTATGSTALSLNTSGSQNTANGSGALATNATGSMNTANGLEALFSNTIGNFNTATGFHALLHNTTGNKNIALGFKAGSDLTTGDKNIDIGNAGLAGESSTIRIGRIQDQTATFIAGIAGATVPTGVAVIVDADGHLGTTTSSARFKEAIKPIDKASESILALKPVTFRYKQELDPDGIPQFGLVAEDVEKVNPDLVARDERGKPYTVRYEAVNAMLLNEFLKEHKKTEKLEATVTSLIATVKEQAAQIQKVSAQLDKGESVRLADLK